MTLSPDMFIVENQAGRRFCVQVLRRGDRYGLNKCLTHQEDEILVEFYDATYAGHPGFDDEGQFVSRYYLSTLMERQDGGLMLHGTEPVWTIDAAAMAEVRSLLAQVS